MSGTKLKRKSTTKSENKSKEKKTKEPLVKQPGPKSKKQKTKKRDSEKDKILKTQNQKSEKKQPEVIRSIVTTLDVKESMKKWTRDDFLFIIFNNGNDIEGAVLVNIRDAIGAKILTEKILRSVYEMNGQIHVDDLCETDETYKFLEKAQDWCNDKNLPEEVEIFPVKDMFFPVKPCLWLHYQWC